MFHRKGVNFEKLTEPDNNKKESGDLSSEQAQFPKYYNSADKESINIMDRPTIQGTTEQMMEYCAQPFRHNLVKCTKLKMTRQKKTHSKYYNILIEIYIIAKLSI